MAAAGLGVVWGSAGADSVDWQDEPQEVPGEEEVAALRTGNQVDIGNIKCIWSNLGKIRVAKVYIKIRGNMNFAGTGKFLWKVEDPSSSVPSPPRICWNFSSLSSVPVNDVSEKLELSSVPVPKFGRICKELRSWISDPPHPWVCKCNLLLCTWSYPPFENSLKSCASPPAWK